MLNLLSKSSRVCLIASLLLAIGCGGGDDGGGGAGGRGGTVGSGGRGGTTGTAGTSGGTTGTAGTGGGAAGASGTTGTGGGGGGTTGASGTTGTGGGSGGRGGAAAGTTGTGGGGGGTAGASGTTGTGGGSGGRGGAAAGMTGTGGGAAGASGTTGAGGTGGGATAGTTGTGGTAGATCGGTLVATAAAVPENRLAEAFSASAATGGTIMEGTYHLTSLSLYTGPGGATGPTGTNRSQTIRISGSTVDVVIISGSSGGGGTTTRLTFSLAPAGSALNLTQTCPAGGGSPALSYTATGNTLTVYSPSNGSNLAEVQVFTLGNPLCTNVFPSSAPVVMMNRTAEALPVANAAGGTLTPGTYHLTTWTLYTGPGGATGPSGQSRSQTLRITAGSSGGSVLEASIAATTGGTGQWLVFNATTSGTSLMLTQICAGAGVPAGLSYSATATTFALYNPGNNTVESYTKQ